MARPRKNPPPFPRTPTETEWAQLAGFFSGEGSIGTRIHPKNDSVQLTLTITQGHRGPLDWVQKRFGGSIRKATQGRGSFSAGKPRFVWYVSSYGEVERILRGVEPYLICKKLQAKLAMAIPHVSRETQHRYHYRIKELKHRVSS
jgi:hypothetical protein